MRDDHQQSEAMTPETSPVRIIPAVMLRIFWPYLRPHKGGFWRLFGASLGGGALCMGRGLAYLVDEGLGRRPALLETVLATALIAVVLAFGSFLRTTMVNKIGELVLADIRRAVSAM